MNKSESIRNPEIKEFYSGSYGFVIKPDSYTGDKSLELAEQLVPNAEFKVSVPHITLFHAKFKELPHKEVETALKELKGLSGSTQKFKDLQVFGNKFLFWNIVKNPTIQRAHSEAFKLAQFLNKDDIARALQEGLTLTSQQRDNVSQFGHPLVQDLYLPHITLGYDLKGVQLPEDVQSYEWEMKIEDVHFAEIGNFGSVKKFIV